MITVVLEKKMKRIIGKQKKKNNSLMIAVPLNPIPPFESVRNGELYT